MILVRDLHTDLVIYIKFSEHVTTGGDNPYKVCTTPLVNQSNYDYRPLNITKTIKSKDNFMDISGVD